MLKNNLKKGASPLVVIGIIVVVGIIGLAIYFNPGSADVSDNVSFPVGNYQEYSSENLSNAQNKVVLFFHAKWCPTCNALSRNILKNIESLPDDVTILRANFDREGDLKRKYGVTVQHTLVQVDNGGNLIDKWTGSSTLNSVLSRLQ